APAGWSRTGPRFALTCMNNVDINVFSQGDAPTIRHPKLAGGLIMEPHPVVSREEWLTARRALLAKEKEATHLRDALNRQRQALPWVKVTADYKFDTPAGRKSLADL